MTPRGHGLIKSQPDLLKENKKKNKKKQNKINLTFFMTPKVLIKKKLNLFLIKKRKLDLLYDP